MTALVALRADAPAARRRRRAGAGRARIPAAAHPGAPAHRHHRLALHARRCRAARVPVRAARAGRAHSRCGSTRRSPVSASIWPGHRGHAASPASLLAVTAVLLLLPAAHAALADAEQLLRRLASTHRLAERLARQHPRFGTYAYATDLAAASAVLIILAGSGRVPWIAHAYAVGVGVTLLIRLTALVRLRTRMPGPRACTACRSTCGSAACGLLRAWCSSIASRIRRAAGARGNRRCRRRLPRARSWAASSWCWRFGPRQRGGGRQHRRPGHVRAAAARPISRWGRSRPGRGTCSSPCGTRTRSRTSRRRFRRPAIATWSS